LEQPDQPLQTIDAIFQTIEEATLERVTSARKSSEVATKACSIS
jgi:hypothetical protein